MLIYAIRHGETEYNIKRLCDSDPVRNVMLTKKGISQAKEASNRLANIKFDAIFISQISRTKETAKIILRNEEKLIVDKRINDRLTGFQDRPVEEYEKALRNSRDIWNAKFGNGESLEEEKNRVFSFLGELIEEKYKTVLVVTHLETIQIISGYFKNLSNREMLNVPVANCQVFKFTI